MTSLRPLHPRSTLARHRALAPWLLPLALSLSGCAALPPAGLARSTPELALPTSWSGATSTPDANATRSLAHWWQRFEDPLLTELITQALHANTSIQAAQGALQQARALRDVKAAALLPGVSSSGSAQRSKSAGNEASNSFRASLDASWEPDLFGGQRSGLNASEAEALASEASLADVQVSVAAEVALAYIQLRGQQNQVQIARTNLASQTDTLQISDWRAQAGLISALEVAQARTATAQTAAQIPALMAGVARSRHSLAVLTGQTPDALQRLEAAPRPIPQASPDLALSIPADTLRQRPDVRAAEHRISAALARLASAEAARYPSFSIGGSLGLNALTLGALTNGASVATSLLGSVSLPLLDGGAVQAQVRAQSGALTQAQANYQGVLLTALKEVEDALVALQGERARLTQLQAAATAAGQADLLAQQRYASGLIDFQTVLQTQRTLLSAQDSVASAQTNLGADHVRLYKALGGGWH